MYFITSYKFLVTDNWQWFYGDRSKMVQVELIEDKEEGCE